MDTLAQANSLDLSTVRNICRLCLKVDGEMNSIFFNDSDDKLVEKILHCTTIKIIPANGIQSSICPICKFKLDELCSFREQCIQCEDLFQSKVKDLENVTIEVVPDIFGFPNDDSNNDWFRPESSNDGERDENGDWKEEEVQVDGTQYMIKTVDDQEYIDLDEYENYNNYSNSIKDVEDNSYQSSSEQDGSLNLLTEIKNDTNDINEKVEIDIKKATFYIKDKKFYQCPFCEKYFNQSGNLKAHVNTHTGYKPYSCELCNRSFAQKSNLNYHMKAAHDPTKPFKCNCCERCFSSMDGMVHHLRTKHGDSNNSHSNTPVPVKLECAVPSPSSNQKRHSCPYCGKLFSQSFNLKLHIHTHTGDKPYKCEVCQKAFAQKSNLNVHITKNHAKVKPDLFTITMD